MNELNENEVEHLQYPIIVKPVDSYSSRGVCKVNSINELRVAFENAVNISRTNGAVVEEFAEGEEITVDVYVEDGKAHVLCLSKLDKISGNDKFVINRSHIPAPVSDDIKKQISDTAQKIVDAFKLKNCPMLIQLISNGKSISVVEFCARTGGGIKFLMIKKFSGFDVVKAVADLTLGEKPHVDEIKSPQKFTVNEFVYCNDGEFDHLEGFDELLSENVIVEYSAFKAKGFEFKGVKSSGDRVAYFSVEADTLDELKEKHKIANSRIKAVDVNGNDLIRHDLISEYYSK